MKQKILMIFTLFMGIVLGLGITELGLRAVQPNLLVPFGGSQGYKPAEALAQNNALSATTAQAKPEDWLVFGGTVAFGQNIAPQDWFGTLYAQTSGEGVYNAAAIGGDNYLIPLQQKAMHTGTKAQRGIFVMDLGQHPEVLASQKQTFSEPQEVLTTAPHSFLSRFALARVMGLVGKPAQHMPQPIGKTRAAKIVAHIYPALHPYSQQDESAVVLLVPARGYWLERGYGAIHRQNQEVMGLALRRVPNLYVVDVAYMMRRGYQNPLVLYDDQGQLNAEGHKMLAEGLKQQVAVFSQWRAFDELSPAEQVQVKKDMEKAQKQQEDKTKKNLF